MVGGDPGAMVKARYIIYIFHQRESFCFEGGGMEKRGHGNGDVFEIAALGHLGKNSPVGAPNTADD